MCGRRRLSLLQVAVPALTDPDDDGTAAAGFESCVFFLFWCVTKGVDYESDDTTDPRVDTEVFLPCGVEVEYVEDASVSLR